jgi:hypothetical protein
MSRALSRVTPANISDSVSRSGSGSMNASKLSFMRLYSGYQMVYAFLRLSLLQCWDTDLTRVVNVRQRSKPVQILASFMVFSVRVEALDPAFREGVR